MFQVNQQRSQNLAFDSTRFRGYLTLITGAPAAPTGRRESTPSSLMTTIPGQVARVKHHPALPHVEVGAFMQAPRDDPGIASRALEIAILTAARANEVIRVEWSESDREFNTWAVPGERMKSKRPHRVP